MLTGILVKITLLVFVLVASLAYGDETNLTLTIDGVTYRNARFGRTTPADVSILHATGVATVPLEKLPPELQKRFGYDPQEAAEYRAAQQAAQRRAASSPSRLPEKGAFVLFEKDAHVLCDQPSLRFSVWNNDEYLLAQAVLWNDSDPSLGTNASGREIGDRSTLMVDVDANKQATPNVDRSYSLNPWPSLPGLRYQICEKERSWSFFKSDSQGRGAIRYVEISQGKRARVDTYLIPLAEISKHVGDRIRLCYWGTSPKPQLTVSSAGNGRGRQSPYAFHIPLSRYHDYVLTRGAKIDVSKVPDGQDDVSPSN